MMITFTCLALVTKIAPRLIAMTKSVRPISASPHLEWIEELST